MSRAAGPVSRLGPLGLIALLSLTAACSPELAPLECVENTTCGAGETCRAGRCVSSVPGDVDVGDGDADDAGDAPTDGIGDAPADGDADTPIQPDADASEEPDASEDADGDLADEDAPPEVVCPADIDCLDGVDTDGDGTDGTNGAVILVDATNGTPGGDGTLAQPVSTLARAVQIASLQPTRNQILLGDARYTTAAPIAFSGPLSYLEIGGGYDPANWTRTPDRSQLIGSEPTAIPVLRFEGIGEVRLSQLDVAAPQGAVGVAGGDNGDDPRPEATAGQTSVAVWAADTTLYLRDTSITAGNGGDGARGRIGRNGPDGLVGGDATEPAGASRPGGAGTVGPTCFDGRPAPSGGDGGSGAEGGDATDGVMGEGAEGGAAGDRDTEPAGGMGGSGAAGARGVGGGPYGYIRGGTWHPVPGSPGQHGQPGSGGGGGSSGFDADGGASDPGGGGGSGACGGEGGGGGSGGGGSIGLYLEDGFAIFGERTSASASDGGDGQNGGSGGSGGTGQGGGAGWGDGFEATSGHDGGPGGNGGIGRAGGGGAGGISVAVLLVGTADLDGGELSFGAGGFGGSRPDAEDEPANAGRRGYAGSVLVFRGLEPNEACRYGAAPVTDADCTGPDGSARDLCVDLYEAVERAVIAPLDPDPDPSDPVGQAIAVPARLPWVSIAETDAAIACRRGGGVLCEGHLLSAACARAAGSADACNFETSALSQTGAFCFNADGIFDLLGNAAEWVAPGCTGDFAAGDTFGGSYLDAPASPDACETRGTASAPSPQIGFRCCSDPALLGAMEFPAPD